MDNVERLAQIAGVDDKRDIGLRGSLRASDNRDAASAQRAKQLSGNAGRVLHILANDGDGGQLALSVHGEHGAILNLGLKLLVEHADGLVGVLVAHTNRGTVLRRRLRHKEHADAVVGKGGENSAVHTDDTHHGKTRHGDERRALDRRDATDGLAVVLHLSLDDGAAPLRVERVLHSDGDVLDANGIDGRRIDHLGSKVAKLHCLHIAQLVDGIGGAYHLGIGRHETVYIGPYLEHLGVERRGHKGCGIIGSATTEIGGLTRVSVA